MADSIKVSGIIHALPEAVQVTEKMRKQNLVIRTEGQYPEVIAVEFLNDKIDLLHGLAEGQKVDVSVNVRGREWSGRYFVSLAGWKVEQVGGQAQQPQRQNNNTALRAQPTPEPIDDSNDLPF